MAAAPKSGTSMSPEVASAGINVGGQFLTSYLAQRAAEEENRKKALMEAAQYQDKGVQGAFQTMMDGWKTSLQMR